MLVFSVTGTFSCTLKFVVRDCDPNTGEPDDDGYDDEYVVSAQTVPFTNNYPLSQFSSGHETLGCIGS